MEYGDGKITNYIWEITDAFVAEVLDERPDGVILSGDLSYNGEKASHLELAEKLGRIKDAGIPVLVIPGNHDINNNSAARIEEEQRLPAEKTSPEDFETIYRAFGYEDAVSRDPNSLSYMYQINDSTRILMLDTCQYHGGAQVGGMIDTDTYEWIDNELEKARCLTVAGLGMSSSLNQLAITLVQIVLNNSLTYYGALSVYGSEIPLASCGIVMKTNGILMAVIIGISQGSQPILGFNYGARQYQRVREVFKLAISCALAVSAAGFLMFQLFPGYIISVFGSGDAQYMEFAVKFMRTFLFMVLINGVQMLSSSMFSAIGKPLKGALLSLTRQVFFVIPLILVLPLIFGIDGVLYAGPVADGAAFLLSVFLVSREFRKMREMEKEIV